MYNVQPRSKKLQTTGRPLPPANLDILDPLLPGSLEKIPKDYQEPRSRHETGPIKEQSRKHIHLYLSFSCAWAFPKRACIIRTVYIRIHIRSDRFLYYSVCEHVCIHTYTGLRNEDVADRRARASAGEGRRVAGRVGTASITRFSASRSTVIAARSS